MVVVVGVVEVLVGVVDVVGVVDMVLGVVDVVGVVNPLLRAATRTIVAGLGVGAWRNATPLAAFGHLSNNDLFSAPMGCQTYEI